jgi:hypothetical protein
MTKEHLSRMDPNVIKCSAATSHVNWLKGEKNFWPFNQVTRLVT